MHLDNESISFHEGDIMIITPHVEHQFEAGANGTILMQLEFLPEIFSLFIQISKLAQNLYLHLPFVF